MLERQPATDSIILIARKNCALSPRQLGRAFAAIASLSLLIGVVCAVIGAWVVLPWSVLETSAVGAAFLWWGRHANDRERIVVSRESLAVNVHFATHVVRHEFNPQWVQLIAEPVRLPGASARLMLRAGGRQVEVGRHLNQAGRDRLARELRAALAQMR